ncbi:MAG: hypothetical protein PW788_10585 [Micavibrio sp.]|nr:hypothetical protein [Micavibrio sp.]
MTTHSVFEEFKKITDVTVEHRVASRVWDDESWFREHVVSRQFNFAARQCVTTLEAMVWNRENAQHPPQISVSGHTQNFSDMETTAELAAMHDKLVELGGTPPAIDDLLPSLKKNPAAKPWKMP